MQKTAPKYLFLLYVSVMLIITFLQQEFVLLPELQNLDIVGEDAKAQLLERYQRMRWVSFLLVPILLALRLSLVSLCLFIGSFFFTETNGKKFKDWWGVATVAQAVMLAYSVILCVVNITFRGNCVMLTKKKVIVFDCTGIFGISIGTCRCFYK